MASWWRSSSVECSREASGTGATNNQNCWYAMRGRRPFAVAELCTRNSKTRWHISFASTMPGPLPVNAELIHTKVVELAREAGLLRKDFKGSMHWVHRLMRRKGFALRRHTSIWQKLPEMYEDKLIVFQLYVNSLWRDHGYMLGQIGNADERSVWFYMPSFMTVCKRRAKEVKLSSIGSQHLSFTVMLSSFLLSADSRKLPRSSSSSGRCCQRRPCHEMSSFACAKRGTWTKL